MADPHGGSGLRMYRSGDMARWRRDGVLEFLGRSDAQVKLRGFRIEPGEIEAVLLRHAGVAGAAVIARSDGGGEQRLIGYVVAAAGAAAPDAAALRAHVAGSLPDYMVPSGYVVLDRLPLTPNGKLDRRALPAPVLRGGVEGGSARTPQEEILCGLFGEVLGVSGVGIWDNFFELGGDSIISIQLVSRARQAGLVITPRAVFQHQTVEALAAAAASLEERAAVVPDIATGALPLTPIMHWLLERGGPIERFKQAMLLQVPAGLHEDDLIGALQAVVDHHDALRLRLVSPARGDAFALEILPAGMVEAKSCVCRIDVCGLDEDARRACITQQARAAEARLAPAAGVMVQAVWFDAGAQQAGRLLLTIHHLAIDGVSWRILVPDLAAAWTGIVGGEAVALAARGTSFRRWAHRLVAEAQAAGRVAEVGFWTGLLSKPAVITGCGGAGSGARHQRQRRTTHAHAAGCDHGGFADASAGGVSLRHQ